MSAQNKTALIRNAAIAALIGSTVGGATGLWSLRAPAATTTTTTGAPAPAVTAAVPVVTAEAPVVTAEAPVVTVAAAAADSPKVSVTARTNTAAPSLPLPVPATVQSATTAPAADTTRDDENVLQRAGILARRPDVAALLALREDVVRRAAERGLADSQPVKTELDELDRRLSEARMLQLKLDAEELRKADSKRPR